MKKQYKAIVLAVLGLGGISAAQAQDALLGFNDATGTQNDYVIDLGAESQFTSTATVNLSSAAYATTFNTAFGSDTSVAAGFVGGGTGSFLLQSYAGGTPAEQLPSGTPSKTQYNSSVSAESAVLTGVYASATTSLPAGDGWSYIIAQSPSVNGAQGANAVAGNTGNPMGTLSSDAITLAVYESTANNYGARTETTTAWQEVGTLAVDMTTGSIVFTGSAVPEPGTYSLLGGAGLLLVSLRNKFSRKQA